MKKVLLSELTSTQRELLEEAKHAMVKAYNPYSHFFVGACLLTKNLEVFSGCNIENAAYSPTICAERAALSKAMADGKRLFTKVAVIAKGADFETRDITAPCGTCRQMLFEASQLSGVDIEVIMSDTKMKKIVVATISELLPFAFGPNDVKANIEKFK